MNIEKVIKVYFFSVMAVIAMITVGQNSHVKQYMTNVVMPYFGAEEPVEEAASFESEEAFLEFLVQDFGAAVFEAKNDNPHLVNIELANDPAAAFAKPGTEDVKLMDIEVQSFEEDFELDELKLKLVAVGGVVVENVYLAHGEDKLLGVSDGEYVQFGNVNFVVEAGEESALAVVVDLKEEAAVGDRLRMDIESSEDVVMLVGGEEYVINSYYPLKGKYLTVVK